MKEIGLRYNITKYAISAIKRKKSWKYLTEDIPLIKNIQKNKKDSKIQRDEILELLIQGYKPFHIVKMGYPQSVVYRQNKSMLQLNNTIIKED